VVRGNSGIFHFIQACLEMLGVRISEIFTKGATFTDGDISFQAS